MYEDYHLIPLILTPSSPHFHPCSPHSHPDSQHCHPIPRILIRIPCIPISPTLNVRINNPNLLSMNEDALTYLLLYGDNT